MVLRDLFQRPAPAPESVTVGRTPAPLYAQALSAATGQAVASVPGLEERARARGVDLTHQWCALGPEGEILCAVVVVPSPGRTAAMLFSVGPGAAHAAIAGRALDAAALDLARDGRIALLQSLPKPGETGRAAALAAGEFQCLARLDYMERTNLAGRAPRPRALPQGCVLTPWNPRDRTMLIELLQRTFEGTLDCPGLAEMRNGPDILDGHLHAGDGDTSLWRILHTHGEPTGAMLLSPCTATDSVDLIYLGLTPAARGRGLGAALLTHGLCETAATGARIVQLAVDIHNAPAVHLYRRAGFVARYQREAWVRPLSSGDSCPQRVDT